MQPTSLLSRLQLARRRILVALAAVSRHGLATAGIVVGMALWAVACNENFITSPLREDATIALDNWRDTLVLGELRPVGIKVLDSKGREILGATVRWRIANTAVLAGNSSSGAGGMPADLLASTDSLHLSTVHTGLTSVTLTVTDPRFSPESVTVAATVVAAEVRLLGVRDTTVTSFGDTSLFRASALGWGSEGSSSLVRVANQGVTWTRIGPALSLIGSGDSVHTIARASGTDTLVATNAFCLRGAHCSDTLIVHVGQVALPLSLATDTLHASSFGDTLVVNAPLTDARGNTIGGTYTTAEPLTAADSAIVGVSTSLGLPPALVSRANGTAHITLSAHGANGTVLGTKQTVVIVRQIATTASIAPTEAEVTPGNSIPVVFEARDARDHLILDAAFSAVMSGGWYEGGDIFISPDTPAGVNMLRVTVQGVAAPAAPISPVSDSAAVIVRIPPPMAAGDTTSTTSNVLSARVLGVDHQPIAGAWVRFVVPVGSLVGSDSVQSDVSGVVQQRWLLPTTVGRYTATAVVMRKSMPPDSAGFIVLRRTSTVVAGAPAAMSIVSLVDTSATIGVTMPSDIVVQLRDAYGNVSVQSDVPVTVSVGGEGLTLSGTLTVSTDSLGQARFGDLLGGGTAGPYVLSFTSTIGAGSPFGTSTSAIEFLPDPTIVTRVATSLVLTSGNSQDGTVGQQLESRLVVTVLDAQGVPMAGVPVSFAAQSGSGSVGTPSMVSDTNGTARTTWTLGEVAGNQGVSATSTAIAGAISEFTALGMAGRSSPLTSTMTAGARSDAGDGDIATTVTVVLRDAFGNPTGVSGGTLTVNTSGGGFASAVTNLLNGTYTFVVTTSFGGSATTVTSFFGTTSASQSLIVSSAPVVPSVDHSTITARAPNVFVGDTMTVIVQLRDANGNAFTASGGTVALNASTGWISPSQDRGDGSYMSMFVAPSTPDTVTITGTLNGSAFTATATITVEARAVPPPAVWPPNSRLRAGTASMVVLDTTTISVQLRDAGGYVITTSRGTVVLTASAGSLSAVTDKLDGTYTAILTAPETPDTVTIAGTIGGETIGEGARVIVTAGPPSATTSTLAVDATSLKEGEATTVILVIRDALGNVITDISPDYVSLTTTLGTLDAVSCSNGTCTAVYHATTAGSASISATIKDTELANSPVIITVGAIEPPPVVPSLANSTIEASEMNVFAGATAMITVQLRDVGGAIIGTSGGTVVLATSVGTLSTVTDNGDGTYTATLTAPSTPTLLTVSGTLNGEAFVATVEVAVSAGAPSATTSTLAISQTDVYEGQTAQVTIVVRDALGNVVDTASPEDVVVDVTLGTLDGVTCSAGTCIEDYSATTAGLASLSATIGGVQILNSPITVNVVPGLTTMLEIPSRVLTQGAFYKSFTPVTASGGTPPYVFTLFTGTLPSGMSLDATTGRISGSPTSTADATPLRIIVYDAAGSQSGQDFVLTVNAALVATQSASSTTLAINTAYTPFTPVTASGGTAPLFFELSGGTLPTGMSFDNTTGQISGTPTATLGTTTFTVTVSDDANALSSSTFVLTVNGPPSAPSMSSVTAGNAQATVVFTTPASDGGSAITTYEYSVDNGLNWTARSPVSAASPLVIAGLTNGITYQIVLRAVNNAGSGTPSVMTPVTPATTPNAPTIGTVTPGNSQLTVAFTAPSSTGGSAVTNYEYSIDNGSTWVAQSPASTVSPLVITGLTNGTAYQVKLRAVNAVGSGLASSSVSATPVTVPGAPTSLTATGGTGNAALTWTAPVSNGGSAITTYLVEYSSNAGSTWTTFVHAASTTTSITVTGLTNGTAYQFRVSAMNAVGTGPTSTSASATPGAPGSPTAVTVAFFQQSPTALDGRFAWTAPVSNGGSAITDYLIEYKTSSASTWTTFAHTASTTASASVPGLVPSTTYNVRISATNIAGTSAPSAIATGTTVGPSSRLACFVPGNSNSSANSITIVPCSGTALGNVILIPVTIANSSTTTAVPITQDVNTTGFTSLGTQLNGANQTTIFYKIAVAGDVGRVTPYGFAWTGNVKNAITLVVYKTTDGAAPAYLSASGTGITATSPAVTVSGSNDYTLVYVYTMVGVALSSTTPTVGEWSVSTDLWKNTTAGANNALAAAITTTDVDKFVAGTTAARDATTASMTATTKWNAAAIVLRAPAP